MLDEMEKKQASANLFTEHNHNLAAQVGEADEIEEMEEGTTTLVNEHTPLPSPDPKKNEK